MASQERGPARKPSLLVDDQKPGKAGLAKNFLAPLPADLLLIPWPENLLDIARRIDHAQAKLVDTRSRLSPGPYPAALAHLLRSSLAIW